MKSLWQLLADHFYPERSDFVNIRNIGQNFADNLMDSFPLLVRRDLGNALHAMLRDGRWFDIAANNGGSDYMGQAWLQEKTNRLYELMYQREANFVRASKEGDHDYVTFGNSCKSVEINRKRDGLLFRTWHLRDCAWFEDASGAVAGVIRKEDGMTRRQAIDYFGEDNLHANIKREAMRDPFKTVSFEHMVIPSDMYGDDELSQFPYVSLWIDKANQEIVEEVGLNHKYYVVPRFQTIAGGAYAYSPATTVGLADARCLQAMTHTLMEAAERYARPPLIATSKVVRSDVDLSADGITWVDEKYDEKLGAALRPLYQDKGGWPVGDAERQRIVETLNSAFYLSKLNLPDAQGREMTAYEVSERMKQFRRENLPLFAPIEAEDNGQICELAFEIAMSNGLLGSPYDIPPSLRGKEVEFKFQSPLTPDETEQVAQRYAQTSQMLGEALQLDPTVGYDIDLSAALRDAVQGVGAPMRWLKPPEQAQQEKQAAAMAVAAEQAQNIQPPQ